MTPIAIKKLLERCSVRDYLDEPLKPEHYEAIVAAINAAPTSSNGHAFSAIIVNNKQMKDLIAGDMRFQQHIKTAALFIIFCADWNRVSYAHEKIGTAYEANDLDQFLVAAGDAFIGATMAQSAAIELDIGTCFVGLIRRNLPELHEWLKLEGKMVPIVGMTFGYAAKPSQMRPKLNKVYLDTYDLKKVQQEVDAYDTLMNKYYNTRLDNAKPEYSWSLATLAYYKPGVSRKTGNYIQKVWQFVI